MPHKKFGPNRFSRFDVNSIQTDKPNLYIDIYMLISRVRVVLKLMV